MNQHEICAYIKDSLSSVLSGTSGISYMTWDDMQTDRKPTAICVAVDSEEKLYPGATEDARLNVSIVLDSWIIDSNNSPSGFNAIRRPNRLSPTQLHLDDSFCVCGLRQAPYNG